MDRCPLTVRVVWIWLDMYRDHWYALGTIPTRRPKQAEGFWCILVKLQKSRQLSVYNKMMTLRIYKVDDFLLSILLHQTLAMPSVLSLSCLLPSLPCFLCYILISDHLPHPMTLLIVFPLQVIVSYLILYCLLLLTYCHITYPLSSSHIPSPRICPTCHLNPFS
jgi:hypothetical protein